MDKTQTTSFYRMRLPHWEVDRGVYFVTVRLAGTLPREAGERIRRLVAEADGKEGDAWLESQRQIFLALESALDHSPLNPHLSDKHVAAMCMETIHTRQELGIWRIIEYAIMPNHIHLFFKLKSGTLREAMVAFKRWTAARAREILGLKPRAFWQREWFDHWSRSPGQDQDIVEYIRKNPVKAGLVNNYNQWPYASWADEGMECVQV